MATVIETMQCFPHPIDFFGTEIPAPEADHEHCPGGHTIPGVLGGWICPCPCHRPEPLPVPTVTVRREYRALGRVEKQVPADQIPEGWEKVEDHA